jgi:hypothetical protein
MMRKWIFLFLLPAMVHAYNPTSKRDCSPLDLRDETLGAVKNQGNISWCYAFTASDMLAHTFSTERISAADIALNYNESLIGRIMDAATSQGRPHETGFNKVALSKAMKDGLCPEEVFPSERWTKVVNGKEHKIPMKDALVEIDALHKRRHELTSANLPYWFKFKHIDKEVFLSLLQTKRLRNVLRNLRLEACQSDRRPYNARWKIKMVFKNRNVFWRVSEQLELGRMVGLDYDARILVNRDHRGVKLSELHTSGIVGRRWNEERNSCEYLIRDSKGVQCTRYDASYDCHDGQVWLGEAEIYGSMTSVVYMLSPRR